MEESTCGAPGPCGIFLTELEGFNLAGLLVACKSGCQSYWVRELQELRPNDSSEEKVPWAQPCATFAGLGSNEACVISMQKRLFGLLEGLLDAKMHPVGLTVLLIASSRYRKLSSHASLQNNRVDHGLLQGEQKECADAKK